VRLGLVLLIADKSLFNVAFALDEGLRIVDGLHDKVGCLITTSSILDQLEESELPRLEKPLDAIWRSSLDQIRDRYFKMLSMKGDLALALEEIRLLAQAISDNISSLNSKLDGTDIELLATAIWIRRHLTMEPIIISDDRDLLRAGHLFASFFGLVPSVLSSFELLRLAKDDLNVGPLCAQFSLASPSCRYTREFQVPGNLLEEIQLIARAGFLSCHPILPVNRKISALTVKHKKR